MKNNFNIPKNYNNSNNRCNGNICNIGNYYKNTIHSLYCVESFLNDFSNYYKYVKLYKLLK